MVLLKHKFQPTENDPLDLFSVTFHPSFYHVQEKLKRWATRFSHIDDPSIFSDLFVLYSTSSKKFLDHRSHSHLFRIVLSIFFMKKKLSRSTILSPQHRNLEIHWIPATLQFPFSSKPVLGCLIGFNVLDRYELFDEENILLALQKYLPELRLVKDSSYCHATQHKNLKLFYLEIEKKNGHLFSAHEQKLLTINLQNRLKNTIQTLSPTIFMSHNEEETYKNILVLSQEIQSIDELPQACISLDYQNGKEIVFLVTLVYISPLHFSPKEDCEGTFVSDYIVAVKELKNRTIEAHIFRIHLSRDVSLLRSDGSLDFYSARQKAAALIQEATGEFRDYNGGIIIKRQELLHSFKEQFPEIAQNDPELIESFFYGITPIAKQVILPLESLISLFTCFLENRNTKLSDGSSYNFKTYQNNDSIILVVQAKQSLIKEIISTVLADQSFKTKDIVYNFLHVGKRTFFTCLLQSDYEKTELLLKTLQQALDKDFHTVKKRQSLRIAMDYSSVSLDPRIGGDNPSADIIKLLFEGLTRFNQKGEIENAIAESIDISSDRKYYIFKLRSSLWNDGSPLTAHDFEYAWKKILSPTFATPFAHLFYPIKNARAAKEGKVPIDEIGINVPDSLTLKVELINPIPYFVQLTACPLFLPIHRFKDKEDPEWPYQSEKNYPCNGPFQLKINQPNQGYQLKKNPFYLNANQIHLDQIFLTPMNPLQAIDAFYKKKIDWVGNPFGTWEPSFTSEKKLDKKCRTIFPYYRICWCAFNTSSLPFNHQKLRNAFAFAVQRNQLVTDCSSVFDPAFAPLLPRHRNGAPAVFPGYDLELARKLFHEALDELNLKKETFRMNLIFNEVGIQKRVALNLKKQIKECFDIDCDLSPHPWNQQFKKMSAGNFEMGLTFWSSWIDDPIYTLSYFKNANDGANVSKWEHPEFQHLINMSEMEIDPEKRQEYLLKSEQILGREMPIIPLFYFPYEAIVRPDLQINNLSSWSMFNMARSFYPQPKDLI